MSACPWELCGDVPAFSFCLDQAEISLGFTLHSTKAKNTKQQMAKNKQRTCTTAVLPAWRRFSQFKRSSRSLLLGLFSLWLRIMRVSLSLYAAIAFSWILEHLTARAQESLGFVRYWRAAEGVLVRWGDFGGLLDLPRVVLCRLKAWSTVGNLPCWKGNRLRRGGGRDGYSSAWPEWLMWTYAMNNRMSPVPLVGV